MAISLPQIAPVVEPKGAEHAARVAEAGKRSGRKTARLSDLQPGETGRIIRVAMADAGCRKRFAELGLAEGMKVTVAGTGDTMMLMLGSCRMGLACRCADEISVVRC